MLIPGVIAHTRAVVEHPETIAERLTTYARLVGRERVIAGADCGFAQGALFQRQHVGEVRGAGGRRATGVVAVVAVTPAGC
jgi:methionine synthase II (cobalamin-independent)